MMTRVLATCPACGFKYVVWVPVIPFTEKCRGCDRTVKWVVKEIGEGEDPPCDKTDRYEMAKKN